VSDPAPNSQTASAMVPLQIILAGGTGMSFEEACAKVFAEFDPPIVFGTYNEVSAARRKANGELGDESPYRNQQSEHILANSAFQSDRGNSASNIAGASNYSEGGAASYNVYDDQSEGTEHRFLTDEARSFEKSLSESPTVGERLDAAENWTKDSLLRDDLQRTKGGPKRSRIKDKESRTKEENEALAAGAAKCLRMKAQKKLEEDGIKSDTETRRGLVQAKRPDAAAADAGMEP
jgi:hypothetical protein